MAPSASMDSSSPAGFCSQTMTFRSVRPLPPLPPQSAAVSVTDFIFSMIHSNPPPPTAAALVDATSGRRILFADLFLLTRALACALRTKFGLSKGDSALILSPNTIDIPVLYLSLLSLGVIISPANPVSTIPEIRRQIGLSKPVLAFATSDTAHKVPSLRYGTVLMDSEQFESLMECQNHGTNELDGIEVSQSDVASILFSSGTTGLVKGVASTHRNWTAAVTMAQALPSVRRPYAAALCLVPLFHAYGLGYCLRTLAMAEGVVVMGRRGRLDLGAVCRAIEEFKVRHLAAAPPVVVVMTRDGGVMEGYDLSSLEVIGCGGAPLSMSVIDKLRKRLPKVQLSQGYGLTETTGRIFAIAGPRESQVAGATGKLLPLCEAKVVDPHSGVALPPTKQGELWVRGPLIMKGYTDDEEATIATIDSCGWLRTGDLCYIDNEGFLYFVDRIKELIKYKGYQVAPAELEHLLNSHPDIVEAAVVPFPDEEAGQVPVAFVARQPNSQVGESQIKGFVAKQVAPYKRLRKVIFISSLPKNATGKILKKELTKLSGGSKLWKCCWVYPCQWHQGLMMEAIFHRVELQHHFCVSGGSPCFFP